MFSISAQSDKATLPNKRFQAILTKDSLKLNQFLADDVIIIHSNGLIENKKEHIHNIMSGKIVYSQMEIKEIVSKNQRKTKINSGIVEVTGKFDGKEFDVRLRFTEVYKKHKGKWQLTNWQSTKIS